MPLLTAELAGVYACVSRRTIERWVELGKLENRSCRRGILVDLDDLDRVLTGK